MSHLCDTDLRLWSEQQAELLRRRSAGEPIDDVSLDWLHVALAIEAVGKSERLALASHIGTIIEHLARLEASPATETCNGWRETILRARADIEDSLESSPSLRPTLAAVVARRHARALRLAAGVLALYGETPSLPLERIRYSTDQVLGSWFPPG